MVDTIYQFPPLTLDLTSVRSKYAIHNPHRGLPIHDTIIYQTTKNVDPTLILQHLSYIVILPLIS